jgi:hypothetical protein
MLNLIIAASAVLAAGVLFASPLAKSRLWRAMTTPLASIIGSGFLVLGPILDQAYGSHGALVMAALCLVAYLFGATIRANIARIDRGAPRHPAELRLESLSSWALAGAYVVSVAYYLNLFGSFGVSQTPYNSPLAAKLLTSTVFLLILIVGWTKGFAALERMEQVSVGLKLAVIVALLVGLASAFGQSAVAGDMHVMPPQVGLRQGITLAFGLTVTVQGFETSRYLGETYDAATRIRSMILAQAVSTAIYIIYILLITLTPLPRPDVVNETSIIDVMAHVAWVLPVLLIIAALAAQFSAAVADTSGSGGLIGAITRGRLRTRQAYAVVVVGGLGLTWTADVFQIISYASRAFGLYYALQAAIAALGSQSRMGRVGAWALALLGLAITLLGTAVE